MEPSRVTGIVMIGTPHSLWWLTHKDWSMAPGKAFVTSVQAAVDVQNPAHHAGAAHRYRIAPTISLISPI
jgi:hypothetical protein